jgi:hypothetical protein
MPGKMGRYAEAERTSVSQARTWIAQVNSHQIAC